MAYILLEIDGYVCSRYVAAQAQPFMRALDGASIAARYLSTKSKGYTLIEVVAVLVILSILAAVVVPRFIDLAESAKAKALEYAVSELDGREYLSWANIKLSLAGWHNDDEVRAQVNYNLGSEYSWSLGPTSTGGTLDFKDHPMDLDRTVSTNTTPPDWK